MQGEDGKTFYRLRAQHECINALPPHGPAPAIPARQDQSRIHLLWFAVAHNMMRFFTLHAREQAAA